MEQLPDGFKVVENTDEWTTALIAMRDNENLMHEQLEKMQAKIDQLEAGPVRCKDCKHRPKKDEDGNLEFPDAKCPCQNPDDDWYSYNPDDDWYCGEGERKDGDQNG